MANFFQNLISKKNGNNNEAILPESAQITMQSLSEIERGNMNQIGYMRAGRNNGDPSALRNSFELIKSGQIVDENNNEQKRKETIEGLDKLINDHKGEINTHKAAIEKIDQVDIPNIQREIDSNKSRIDELKNNTWSIKFKRNRFNLILTWIGFIAGFIYLYLFYVSAIHSALFRNIAGEVANADQNSISILLNNVFNISAFKEFNIHWFAPIVFFIFALILHFSLEIRTKVIKWAVVLSVVLFVLTADGLLAYSIENNNHTVSELMGLSDGSWVFYKSFVFYLVLFFVFFTSIGWSLVLHKLACEFEASNPERENFEKILNIDKVLRQLYFDKGVLNTSRIEKVNLINTLEEKIKAFEAKKSNVHYSLVDLERSIDDFYSGWLSYLNGLRSDHSRKQDCENVYISFKSATFNRSLTA